jgi:hypothetical protein
VITADIVIAAVIDLHIMFIAASLAT